MLSDTYIAENDFNVGELGFLWLTTSEPKAVQPLYQFHNVVNQESVRSLPFLAAFAMYSSLSSSPLPSTHQFFHQPLLSLRLLRRTLSPFISAGYLPETPLLSLEATPVRSSSVLGTGISTILQSSLPAICFASPSVQPVPSSSRQMPNHNVHFYSKKSGVVVHDAAPISPLSFNSRSLLNCMHAQ